MFKLVKNINNKTNTIKKIEFTCDKRGNIPQPLEPYHFFSIIIGKPRTGKTSLIINLINRRGKFYNKCFNKVIIWSPSLHTLKEPIYLPKDRFYKNIDFEELQNEINELEKNEGLNIETLFIFDDVINQISKKEDDLKKFMRLVDNRRHLNLSILFVTQKYNKLPLSLRVMCSSIFLFETAKTEYDAIYKDLIKNLSKKQFDELLNFVFDKPKNIFYIVLEDNLYYKNFNKIVFDV